MQPDVTISGLYRCGSKTESGLECLWSCYPGLDVVVGRGMEGLYLCASVRRVMGRGDGPARRRFANLQSSGSAFSDDKLHSYL